MSSFDERGMFEAFYDVIPFDTYIVDVETYEIVYMNRAMRATWGDLNGQTCHKALYEEDSPCWFCRNKDLLNEKMRPNGENIIFDHFNEANDHWYQLQEKAIGWPDGRTVKISIGVDITELKETQNQLAEAHAELALKSRELERLSVTDKLTGIYNRAKLDLALQKELERSKRYENPLSIILLDLDHFKSINDRFGHPEGDKALECTANQLSKHVRDLDIVGRWGGEEFMVICPETTLDGAQVVAEKLREMIGTESLPCGGKVTASFGVAQLREGESEVELLQRVDRALYRAKESGRNRVEAE